MISDRRSHLIVFVAIVIFTAVSAFTWPQQPNAEHPSLKPVKTVYPAYPDHLKEEGITGEVIIYVEINEKGEVKRSPSPILVRHLNPELDQLALDAVKQWRYEPVLYKGKPISFPTFISVIFEPGEPLESVGSSPQEPTSEELTVLLNRCWEYGRKIDDLAHFYVCREKVSETIRNVVQKGVTISMLGAGTEPWDSTSTTVPVLGSSSRNSYLSEYQLTNRDSRVIEQRTSIKLAADQGNSLFGKKPLRFPIPITIPSQLVAPGFRFEFSYSLGGDDKVLGKDCSVIDVKARKKRGTQIKKGTVWVEKRSYRVVKAEVELSSYGLDERILAECKPFYLTPDMTVTYEFGIENNGILYPSRSEIRLDYTGLGPSNIRATKENLNIRYDHYRFFIVDTETKIIK